MTEGIVVNLPKVLTGDQEDALNAGVLIVEMDCTAAELVGDLVRLHAVTANTVQRATDNLVDRPVIGWIKSKITTIRCRVATRGIIAVAHATGRVYLSDTGVFTSTPPALNYIQALGYSFGNGKLNLDPELKLTFKTP